MMAGVIKQSFYGLIDLKKSFVSSREHYFINSHAVLCFVKQNSIKTNHDQRYCRLEFVIRRVVGRLLSSFELLSLYEVRSGQMKRGK